MNRRVLVVDDDRVTLKIISSVLRQKFDVLEETNGALVMERAETEKPELILLDLNIPHVDGFEILQKLTVHPLLRNVPVFCVSGLTDEASRNRAYQLGAAGFIVKPIRPEVLSQDLDHLLTVLNKKIASPDGSRSVFIGYNALSVHEKMKAEIAECLASGKKPLVLSYTNGANFFKEEELEPIKSKKLVFCQIEPSLMARLPYLEDLTIVIQDLQKLIEDPIQNYTLFFDGPEITLNTQNSDLSLSTTFALTSSLRKNFPTIHFYCRAARDTVGIRRINELATHLVADL